MSLSWGAMDKAMLDQQQQMLMERLQQEHQRALYAQHQLLASAGVMGAGPGGMMYGGDLPPHAYQLPAWQQQYRREDEGGRGVTSDCSRADWQEMTSHGGMPMKTVQGEQISQNGAQSQNVAQDMTGVGGGFEKREVVTAPAAQIQQSNADANRALKAEQANEATNLMIHQPTDLRAVEGYQSSPIAMTTKPSLADEEAKATLPPKVTSPVTGHRCVACNKSFKRRKSLVLHQRTHEPRPPREPRLSGASMPGGDGKNRPHKCAECTAAFTRADHLRRHSAALHSPRPSSAALTHACLLLPLLYRCDDCEKAFTRAEHLRRHALTHSAAESAPSRCEVCDKEFSRPDLLKRHAWIHLGLRPHSCDVCDRSFARKDKLTRHLRSHAGALMD